MQRPQKAIVIHSPHSGRSAQLTQALTYLQEAGVQITQVISIADLDDLPAQGVYWRDNGIEVAIAAGGDGLVGGVITHIVSSALPLGILPLGTSNDIARSLHIPQDLLQAAEVIASGKEQEVDIGIAQPAEQAPHIASSTPTSPVIEHVARQKHGFFAHALTVGLNVEFARLATNVATRQRYGRLTYPVVALGLLKSKEALEVSLRFEGIALPPQTALFPRQHTQTSFTEKEQSPLHYRALQVAVVNAPIFGGQWQLAIPGATMSDGLLDIVVIEDIDLSKLNTRLADFFNLQKQQALPPSDELEQLFVHHPAELTDIPGIHHIQARGVTITTNADPRDVTLDGEVRGQTPMHVRMAEERLPVLVPS